MSRRGGELGGAIPASLELPRRQGAWSSRVCRPTPIGVALTLDGRGVICSSTDRWIRRYALPDSALSNRKRDAQVASEPLARTFEGKISDVAVGGGGRYLILTLKDVP